VRKRETKAIWKVNTFEFFVSFCFYFVVTLVAATRISKVKAALETEAQPVIGMSVLEASF